MMQRINIYKYTHVKKKKIKKQTRNTLTKLPSPFPHVPLSTEATNKVKHSNPYLRGLA